MHTTYVEFLSEKNSRGMKWYYYVYGAAVICHEKPFGPPSLLVRRKNWKDPNIIKTRGKCTLLLFI